MTEPVFRMHVDDGFVMGQPMGERRLIAAVLHRALADAYGLANISHETRSEAIDWIQSDNPHRTFGGFTFQCICDYLGLHASNLRLAFSRFGGRKKFGPEKF